MQQPAPGTSLRAAPRLRAAAGLALVISVILAVLSPVGALADGAGPPAPVSVFPIVGSQVAPPGTQIAFRGVNPFAIGSVTVSGSLSGSHSGSLQGDSDGNGASFILDKPFTPGEIVSVKTSLNLVGAPGGSYQFRVATSPGPIPPAPVQKVSRMPGDVLRFQSRPDLHPAALRFLRNSRAAPDDLFLAPQFGPVQDGPMLLDSQGGLVWFRPVPTGDVAADFRIQRYQGQPVLTWWQGYSNAGVGVGEDEIYDSSYHRVAAVDASGGLSADLHEFLLTPQGTALILAYFPVTWDTSAVGGSRHKTVLDSVVQEIDVQTGLLLFQWDSLDHVPVQDSESVPARSFLYDYFHVNSVEVDQDSNLVISARNTWAAYKIDRSSGAVMWTLGGKHSSFKLMPGASFAFQHDVRVQGPGDRELTLFDDGGAPPTVHPQSRGLTLRLDFKHMTASVAAVLDHTPPLRARFQGNLQRLPNGDELIGWGQQPYFTEFGVKGRVLLDARFVGGTSSYRVYAFAPWTATPDTVPALAAHSTRRSTTVYASWNGSTQTAFWLVLSGSRLGALSTRELVRRAGFETAVQIPRARYVRVEAMDFQGHVLASSPAVKAT
jgi:hypothetical protein